MNRKNFFVVPFAVIALGYQLSSAQSLTSDDLRLRAREVRLAMSGEESGEKLNVRKSQGGLFSVTSKDWAARFDEDGDLIDYEDFAVAKRLVKEPGVHQLTEEQAVLKATAVIGKFLTVENLQDRWIDRSNGLGLKVQFARKMGIDARGVGDGATIVLAPDSGEVHAATLRRGWHYAPVVNLVSASEALAAAQEKMSVQEHSDHVLKYVRGPKRETGPAGEPLVVPAYLFVLGDATLGKRLVYIDARTGQFLRAAGPFRSDQVGKGGNSAIPATAGVSKSVAGAWPGTPFVALAIALPAGLWLRRIIASR